VRSFGYYFSAGIALAIGLGMLACGVAFVIAGADEAHPLRPLIGASICVVGVLGVALGVRMALRPLRAPRPEILAIRVVTLARALGGEVTLARVVAGLRVSEQHARAAVERLIADGVCVHEQRDAEDWYVFPSITGR